MSEIALRLVRDSVTNSSSCLKSYSGTQYSILNSERIIKQFTERLDKIEKDLENMPELSHLDGLIDDIKQQKIRLQRISKEHTFLYKSLLVHLKFLIEELTEAEEDIYQAVNAETAFGGDELPWDL